MSEEKTKCSNPECGKEVSDNVKQYSLDTKTDTVIELTGTPEQLGKEIYWLLCGKKEEVK